jgi:hypothetical protein
MIGGKMENLSKSLGSFSAVLLVLAACYAVFGWLMMLCVGTVHSIFGWPTTISFVQGIELSFVFTFIGSVLNIIPAANKNN